MSSCSSTCFLQQLAANWLPPRSTLPGTLRRLQRRGAGRHSWALRLGRSLPGWPPPAFLQQHFGSVPSEKEKHGQVGHAHPRLEMLQLQTNSACKSLQPANGKKPAAARTGLLPEDFSSVAQLNLSPQATHLHLLQVAGTSQQLSDRDSTCKCCSRSCTSEP